MTRLLLNIFETLRTHRTLRWGSLVLSTVLLALLLTQQSYQENIIDFLPLDNGQQQALQDYQQTSSARRIYVIFRSVKGSCQSALDDFCDLLDHTDESSRVEYLTADDPAVMQEAMTALYARMPYLLTADDYARMDSLTALPDFVVSQLENDKQLLMLPTAGMLSVQVQHDPLQLFTPVLERMKPTSDNHQTLLLIDSPYGPNETAHNAQLVALLQQYCDSVGKTHPEVSVHLTGGPVIAVGNARQIKTDSITAISLAVVLILLLLWLTFRNVRNLLLIAVSIGWGWLFAMGSLTLVHQGVSIIVIGISSVIVGIAVNYPLHLIAHLSHTPDMRSTLREIVMPLVVGNITTVGAFLVLVPLNAVALRDLGLFSAFLLVGTILFALLWLPHLVQHSPHTSFSLSLGEGRGEVSPLKYISSIQLENKPWLVAVVVVLTFVLGYFSQQTSFDADLRNINYMTAEQRQDMQMLQNQFTTIQSPSPNTQSHWNAWRTTTGAALCQQLKAEAAQAGFSPDSFGDFYDLVNTAPSDGMQSLSESIVNNLSDNFNYIGWACGVIVFFFLWFSLGSIELALLSFLPMAISWIWILGLMSLLGIQFNVVNIILATFIFGQGDDYTIFMTEGCQYEYAYRRQMLSSYKESIFLSALIMLIGIGSLIVARHPALLSLAHVTIVGMFTVVLMAWLIPPLIFRWLVFDRQGNERRHPLTLRRLLMPWRKADAWQLVADRYRYCGIEIAAPVRRRLRTLKGDGSHCNATLDLGQESSNFKLQTSNLKDSGFGETALLMALQHPERQFTVTFDDEEHALVARHAIEGFVNNLKIVQ